jgi:Ca-activated chloride channel family protein
MDLSARVRFDHELLAVERGHEVACMLELVAPPAPARPERRPLAVALVIDRSGSMAGEKLDVTHRSADFLVEHLSPKDRLAIVSFDDEVRLEAPLVEVGPNRPQLRAAIARIHAGGMTNLSGGWLKGVEALSSLEEEGPTRRVLLLTDGMANVGIADASRLATMARASAGDRIGTSTIGFGEGFDEDLLTAMADAGGGGAHFAPSPDAAPGIFAQEFDDLLSLVAQNVSAEIRPVGSVATVLEILNDFPQVPVNGGVQVMLGDAYGEEHRRVVFRLQVPGLVTLGPTKIAEVLVRYVGLGEEVVMHELTVPLIVNAVSADEAAAAVPDAEVTEEVVILLAAKAQEQARDLADRGLLDEAGARLHRAADQLRRTGRGSARAEELQRHADQLESHGRSLSEGLFDATTRKHMTFENRERRQRRKRPGPS